MRTREFAAIAALFSAVACSDEPVPTAQEALAVASPDAGLGAPDGAECGGDTFCTDFEDQTGSTRGGAWRAVAPNCHGDGKLAA